MGSTYDGLPGNIVFPSAVNIASSTNASPIAVTTSTPHGLLTGDVVDVRDHQTNTGANGIRTITKTGASTFTLNGSTGTGVGGATGTVQPLTYGAAGTIPSDGDNDAAAVFNAAYVPLFDRTAALIPLLPPSKVAIHAVAAVGGFPSTPVWHVAGLAVTAGNLYQFVSDGAAWGTVSGSGFTALPSSGGIAPVFELGGVVAGDSVTVQLDGTVPSGNHEGMGIYFAMAAPGVTPTWPGSYSSALASKDFNAISTALPMTLVGSFTIPSSGNLWIQPILVATVSTTSTFTLNADARFSVDVYRTTGVPQ